MEAGMVPHIGDAGDLPPHEQAMLAELLGDQTTRKGALRRGIRVLPRILPYLRPYKKFAIISVIITLLLALVALAEPWPLAFAIDSIIGRKPPPGWVTGIFGAGVGAKIALAVVATLFLTALAGVMTVWNEYLSTTVDQKMVLDFRCDMMEHAQKLSLRFHDTESKGILMYRINNQAAAMGQIVIDLPTVAQNLLMVIGMAYISVTINPLLALLALGTTPFVIYSTTFYTERIEPRLYRVRGLGAINLAIVYEAMAMIRVVLAFGTQRREWKRFRQQGESLVSETVGLTVRQTAFKLAVELITAAGTASVIGVGAWEAVHKRITAGELLVIISYLHQVYQPLEGLTNTITSFQQQFIALLMSFELMDIRPEVTEKPDALPLERARGELELADVGFGYTGRPDVLKNISFRIPAGRAVAIVGPTGAGKSTLVNLLPRFYDADEGSVRVDGHDVRDLKLADLRKQFSIVLQEPLLFSGTIEANVKYSKPDASEEEVVEAAKAANAHEFISALPDGYQTLLGEQGTMISGGERQRIAVARAFLRDAPILVLDEPTSSIDSRTESVILDALERLMKGRTAILIAHRLSTLRSVEEILVVDDGEIVQSGTHEELAGQAGLYKQLWDAQTRGAGGPPPPAAPAVVVKPERPQLAAVAPLQSPEPNWEQPAKTPVAMASAEAKASANADTPAAQKPPSAEAPAEPTALALPAPSVALPRPKIVLLGMLTKIPVGGVVWLLGHYVAGFKRLGYDVYYVEAHARTPSMFMTHPEDDGAGKAAAYIAKVARRFGFEDRWAFQALHENGRCYGMAPEQLDRLYRDAALIVNMHGGTLPLPEHAATDRLVFLGTDPVEVELEVERGDKRALEFLDQHVAHFTWGLNYGNPDCRLPWAHPYSFIPSPPPVVLDFWENAIDPSGPFTTIGNWRQEYRDIQFRDRVYKWSKHQQFAKILDLPMRSQAHVELALSSYDGRDRLLLAEHGWRVRPGFELSKDPDAYRDYIVGSAGEISAAKEQNVYFRTGWFSERSATYLAAGRPVILQDTGFGAALPTGEGLFAFSDLDDAVDAVTAVQADPARHRRAAAELAREYLSHEVVLGDMLDHVGLRRGAKRHAPARLPARVQLPEELSLEVVSRDPLELCEDTTRYVLGRPIPGVAAPLTAPVASIVLAASDNLVCTRLALESVLANTEDPAYQLMIGGHGVTERTRTYLEVLAARNRHVHVFGAGCDRAIAASGGEFIVLLEGDMVVTPGWIEELIAPLDDPAIGIVSATTSRSGGVTQVPASYATYGDLMQFARRRREQFSGTPAPDAELGDGACIAIRRADLGRIGPLDDQCPARVREAGLRVVRSAAAFLHHFDQDWAGSSEDAAEPAYEREQVSERSAEESSA